MQNASDKFMDKFDTIHLKCISNVICSNMNDDIIWIIMIYKNRSEFFPKFNVSSWNAAVYYSMFSQHAVSLE